MPFIIFDFNMALTGNNFKLSALTNIRGRVRSSIIIEGIEDVRLEKD